MSLSTSLAGGARGPLNDPLPSPVCASPMVYFDCRNATPGAAGAGCQKSCHTLDMDCVSVPSAPVTPQ